MGFAKSILKAAFFVSLLNTSYASTISQLPNFATLMDALNRGEDVSAIIHFDKCKLNDKAGPKATTRVNFNIFSHYQMLNQGQPVVGVATSNTILTEHRDFGPVYAYGRLRIFENNSAEFHAAYYDAKNMELKGKADYQCQVGVNSEAGVFLIKRN